MGEFEARLWDVNMGCTGTGIRLMSTVVARGVKDNEDDAAVAWQEAPNDWMGDRREWWSCHNHNAPAERSGQSDTSTP